MKFREIGCAAALSAVVLLVGGAGDGISKARAEAKPVIATEALAPSEMLSKWGVSMKGARLTAQGHLIRVVYHVYDADKAAPLLNRANKAFLIQGDDLVIPVPVPPKIGALRQNSSNPKADRDYYILFSNPSGRLHAGDQVSLSIGDFFRADDLVIKGVGQR